ncbi:uncharacterized protein HMPREF1541_08455, partial [Cyphellophora europaea CBS 101466]
RLEIIDGRIEAIERTTVEATSDSIDLQAVKNWQTGILRCIQICDQSFEHVHQVDSGSRGRVNPSGDFDTASHLDTIVNQSLQDSRNRLNLRITKVERHLKDIADRMAETSRSMQTADDVSLHRTELQEELGNTSRCIDICLQAQREIDDRVGKSSRAASPQNLAHDVQERERAAEMATPDTPEILLRNISRQLLSLQNRISSTIFESHRVPSVTDNTLATQQVILSTKDHFDSVGIAAGHGSRAILGLMSDETMRQLLSWRSEYERKHIPGGSGPKDAPFQNWKRELLDIHQELEFAFHSINENKAPTDSGYASVGTSTPSIDTSEESASHNDSSRSPDFVQADLRRDDFRPALKAHIGRVIPCNEDIGSQKACSKIAELVVAEKHLESLLLESDILISIVRQTIPNRNMSEFLEDFRELLKYYHIDLRQEARTNLQNATAMLLRSHWYRARIARRIFHKITNQEPLDSNEEDENPRYASDPSLYDLNDWLANNQGFNDPNNGCRTPPEIDESQFSTDEDTSDIDSELHEAVKDLKYIKSMEDFVFRSKSFRKLLERVQMLTISPVYHD